MVKKTKMTTKLQFGLMTGTDEKILLETMNKVNLEFPDGVINTLEVGVHKGHTSRAIHQFFTDSGRVNFHTAIDNCHDLVVEPPFDTVHLIIGNSIEVYPQIKDNSQHFIFLDGCHSYVMTMADLLVYSDKVAIGGYIALHDTSPHIKPFQDYQNHGSKFEADFHISCRKALTKLGVYENKFPGFFCVFDDSDPKATTGGVTVIKRVA